MRRTIEIARRAAAVLAGTTLGACAPVLSHGPRVTEGTSVGVSLAALSVAGESMTAAVPYLKSGERYDDGTARQFTVQLVIPSEPFDPDDSFLYGMQFDYYREAASDDPDVAHGMGVHVGLGQVMPYGQWGLYRDRVGLYTTQGFGVVGTWFGVPPEAVFWSPGAGVEYLGDGFALRAQMSTALIWSVEQGELAPNAPLALGLTFELGGRKSEP